MRRKYIRRDLYPCRVFDLVSNRPEANLRDNDQAHLPGRCMNLMSRETSMAAPFRCSAWFTVTFAERTKGAISR
jgi:hypothetical protein